MWKLESQQMGSRTRRMWGKEERRAGKRRKSSTLLTYTHLLLPNSYSAFPPGGRKWCLVSTGKAQRSLSASTGGIG